MPALAGQVVLITGASSGIGEAIARRLARTGAKLVITARRPEQLTALARELDPSGSSVLVVVGDITSDADRRTLVADTLKKFGRVDALGKTMPAYSPALAARWSWCQSTRSAVISRPMFFR